MLIQVQIYYTNAKDPATLFRIKYTLRPYGIILYDQIWHQILKPFFALQMHLQSKSGHYGRVTFRVI